MLMTIGLVFIWVYTIMIIGVGIYGMCEVIRVIISKTERILTSPHIFYILGLVMLGLVSHSILLMLYTLMKLV